MGSKFAWLSVPRTPRATYTTRMSGGDAAAWAAVALFPVTFAAGWILRRYVSGTFARRLRPHYVLGYAVLVLGSIHGALAMGGVRTIGTTDVWVATLAFAGLSLQAFLGASLQAPGVYRSILRRWHFLTAGAVAILIAGHVLLTI